MNKKILVTGAAGFVGFHTALKLAGRGDFVVGIDDFNPYYSPQLKKDRASILKEQGISIIEGDICNRTQLKSLFQHYNFTHVVHLAAQAGVRYAKTHPDAYLKSNLEGFLSLLEVCKEIPDIKFIYASSSSVYGCNEKTPFSETDQTDRPANLYAATKKANELIAYSYHHVYGLHATGLRFFTVYGPWGRPDMAYYSFTKAILEGKPIHLFNEGKMQRDFTYIDDVVEGLIAAVDLGASWEIFNLGNHSPVELLSFVDILENQLGVQATKVFEKRAVDEVASTYADISHAQKRLGFAPKTSLAEGLHHFIEWYTSYHRVIIPAYTVGSASIKSDAIIE